MRQGGLLGQVLAQRQGFSRQDVTDLHQRGRAASSRCSTPGGDVSPAYSIADIPTPNRVRISPWPAVPSLGSITHGVGSRTSARIPAVHRRRTGRFPRCRLPLSAGRISWTPRRRSWSSAPLSRICPRWRGGISRKLGGSRLYRFTTADHDDDRRVVVSDECACTGAKPLPVTLKGSGWGSRGALAPGTPTARRRGAVAAPAAARKTRGMVVATLTAGGAWT